MAKRAAKNLGGAPKAEINLETFRQLCQLQCTEAEIAGVFKVNIRTIKRRLKEPEYQEAWLYGKANGRASLRRLQWRHAQGAGSSAVQMTIHLSKHWLGETDKAALELSGRVDSKVEVTTARERITRKLDTLRERIASRVAGIAAAAGATTLPVEPVGK